MNETSEFGIGLDTIDDALEAGATRVAVSSAILQADRPREAARALRAKLDQVSRCVR